MSTEKGTISIHTENIFPIIKKFLYSDHEIFLRELISNAVDATQKLKRLSLMGEIDSEVQDDLMVEVKIDAKKKTLTVSDQGIGMTAEEIKKYINQIAFSGATEFVEKYQDKGDPKDIIGHFGLGFYSAFMVSDNVEIDSLSHAKDAEPAHWICDGSTEYSIKKGKRKTRGTDIILHINEDSAEFLEEHRIRGILNKYCKFLPVSIKFGEKEETIVDEKGKEDKDGKKPEKTIKVDDIVNNPNPIWVKSPAELTDADYLGFYRELYPMSEEPLFWIHLNVDYPFELTGILYFPKLKNDFEVQKDKINLYSRQVFITDEVKDIVPEFLMMLHGVIDSPDIPLNVSRSFLQADGNVKKITNHITKKVGDKLKDLFREDRKAYEAKWDDIGLFVKYGFISDEKFYEKANPYGLFKNVDGEYFTFEEYTEKITANQTDKDDAKIAIYSSNIDDQDAFIQSAKKRSYDVLLMDGPLDNHLVNQLEMKLDKVRFKRVDSDTIDKLIDKDEKAELIISDEDKEKLKKVYEEAVGGTSVTFKVEALPVDEMPISITKNEFMRRMKDMQKMGGGGAMMMMGDMPLTLDATINGNHPLAQKIISTKDDDQKGLAKQVYDLALLSQNMLKGSELTSFIQRSVDILAD